jgi:hypothetical protein
MADKKISELALASTPLAGSETLPIVQTGATVQVSVSNLTAGRGVSATSVANGLGAAGTPSYTFTGDLNTGMWSPAADTLAVSTGGTERVRVTSVGSMLVATTSASTTSTLDGLVVSGTTSAIVSRRASGASQTHINFVNNGVSVGTINTSTTATTYNTSSTSGVTGVDANTITVRTNSAERVRVTSTGAVGIGTASPNAAAQLDVTSTTSGFLPPRMTEAQRDLIATPPNGLMLYNTTTDKLQVRAAGAWVDLH